MESFKCPICGGTLEISLLSSEAVCDSCGNRVRVGFDQTKEYRRVVHEAEKAACLNTVDGYADAIELLESIPFVKEAKTKTTDYQTRVKELQNKHQAREEAEQESTRRETGFGAALIVVVLLVVLAAAAGAVVIVVRLVQGRLSPQMTVVLGVVIAVLAVGAIVGKIRG